MMLVRDVNTEALASVLVFGHVLHVLETKGSLLFSHNFTIPFCLTPLLYQHYQVMLTREKTMPVT